MGEHESGRGLLLVIQKLELQFQGGGEAVYGAEGEYDELERIDASRRRPGAGGKRGGGRGGGVTKEERELLEHGT